MIIKNIIRRLLSTNQNKLVLHQQKEVNLKYNLVKLIHPEQKRYIIDINTTFDNPNVYLATKILPIRKYTSGETYENNKLKNYKIIINKPFTLFTISQKENENILINQFQSEYDEMSKVRNQNISDIKKCVMDSYTVNIGYNYVFRYSTYPCDPYYHSLYNQEFFLGSLITQHRTGCSIISKLNNGMTLQEGGTTYHTCEIFFNQSGTYYLIEYGKYINNNIVITEFIVKNN